MNSRIILLFVLFANYSFGQNAVVKEIKQKNPITKEVYVFPNIIFNNSKTVEQKINNSLRSEILSVDSGTSVNKIFDQVWRTKEQSPTLSDITYSVIRNSQSILSLSITAEGCGAYCETGTNYFTFNLKTGNKLSLDSIFTYQGITILVDSLNRSKTGKIKAKIREIQSIIKSNKFQKDKDQKEYYLEMLDLYKDCLNKRVSLEYMSNLKFVITNKRLKIYSDRCSAHYNMAMDELWSFEYVADLKYWLKYLTSYGLGLMKK